MGVRPVGSGAHVDRMLHRQPVATKEGEEMKTENRTHTTVRLALYTTLLSLALGWSQAAESTVAAADAAAPAVGGLTFGAGGNDEEAAGYLDLLMRITGREHDLLYLAPRISVSDASEEEFNLGLGYRHLWADLGLIGGGNLYYDSRWTANDNRFDQFGAGLELLSTWVDLRANYYWPEDDRKLVDQTTTSETTVQQKANGWGEIYTEGHGFYQPYTYERVETTTSRTYRRYEEALEGYDAEIGVKLPFLQNWAEARLFVGFQDFDGPQGQDLDGPKGRAEVYALPGLILDAEVFDNKALNHSDFYVGARVRLPFDITRLARGENPFAGSAAVFKSRRERSMAERMDEVVRRDPKIRTHKSNWEENAGARAIATARSTSAETLTLMDNVTFVDGDNASGVEDGTAENPYNTVAEGVDNASSPVYVAEAATDYIDNVVLPEDVDLYGAGIILRGEDGRTYGGRPPPVLRARTADPTITIAGNNVTIAGLAILNTFALLPAMPSSGAAIYANGVTGIDVHDNIISAAGHGVLLVSSSAQDFSARVVNNLVHNCGLSGVRLDGNTAGGRFEFEASGDFLDNGYDGLSIAAFSNSAGRPSASLYLHDLTASGNGNDGLAVNVHTTGELDLTLRNITANRNYADGIEEIHLETTSSSAPLTASFANVITDGNGGDGFEGVDAQTWGDDAPLTLTMTDFQANDNREQGIVEITLDTYGDRSAVAATLSDVVVNNNGAEGIESIHLKSLGDDSPAILRLERLTALQNAGDGIKHSVVYATGAGSATTIAVTDSRFEGNGGSGLSLDDQSSGALLVSGSTFIDNATNGLAIDRSAWTVASVVTYNLGDATTGTGGQNSFSGNGNAAIALGTNTITVKAENNWWGADQDPAISGVDADPRLTADPN